MSTELSRGDVIQYALNDGLDPTEITEAGGPGRLEGSPDRPLTAALDFLVSNGQFDEQTGDTEAPTGHVTRYARWLLRTSSQGFVTLTECDTELEARAIFASTEGLYNDWSVNE